MLTLIAAADDEWGIGKGGDLPWRIREDLLRFRERTMGQAVVMGRRTVASLPAPLKGREVLTVSRSGDPSLGETFPSVAKAYEIALRRKAVSEVFAAGGAAVYLEAAGIAHRAEITRVPGTHGCDVRMPDLAALGWTVCGTERLGSSGLLVETWVPAPRERA
jgi:dihydrofolate reductase